MESLPHDWWRQEETLNTKKNHFHSKMKHITIIANRFQGKTLHLRVLCTYSSSHKMCCIRDFFALEDSGPIIQQMCQTQNFGPKFFEVLHCFLVIRCQKSGSQLESLKNLIWDSSYLMLTRLDSQIYGPKKIYGPWKYKVLGRKYTALSFKYMVIS